jgi:hypothetical protein
LQKKKKKKKKGTLDSLNMLKPRILRSVHIYIRGCTSSEDCKLHRGEGRMQ